MTSSRSTIGLVGLVTPYASIAFAGLVLVACSSQTTDAASEYHGDPKNAGTSSGSDPGGYGGSSSGSSGASSGETYGKNVENDWVDTATESTSTFGIDVDTGSYSLMRRDINENRLPNPDGVRAEEFLNYFTYSYAPPTDDKPFAVHLDGAPSFFGEGYHLLRIGLQGRSVATRNRANLVFLVDVSGSMNAPNKLPLVKYTLSNLVNRLQPNDTLAIVTYAGYESVLIQPTLVSNKSAIQNAIEGLSAGGGTNGEGGIRKAYALAEQIKSQESDGSINRVVLCTDGDFNVGLTGDALVKLIEEERDKGVTLTTLGYGDGNYNDRDMERLADHGNGNYAYIDSQAEADRVVGKKLVSTLQVIAKDAKIQIEMDPAQVKKYRLIGYENRVLKNDEFADDKKDSGELGAGHSVTALYEVELTQAAKDAQTLTDAPPSTLATVRLRYKAPEGTTSSEFTQPFSSSALFASFDAAPADLRFAAATAEYAEILHESKHSEGRRFTDVLGILGASTNGDADRIELKSLVQKASAIAK